MKIDRGENSPRIIQGSAEFSQSSTSFRALSELECIKNSLLLLNWPYAEILKTQLEMRSAQGSCAYALLVYDVLIKSYPWF